MSQASAKSQVKSSRLEAGIQGAVALSGGVNMQMLHNPCCYKIVNILIPIY